MEGTATVGWPLKATKLLTYDHYTVAWICALPHEKAAARNMLDELHLNPQQPTQDKNIYTLGSICGHNVVIVCQGDMGTEAAAVVATRMDMTFRRLRFGLLVGIAGGVPDRNDIRLGDVVISKGDGQSGGVVAHDHGQITPMGFESRPFLSGVPEILRNAFNELKAQFIDRDAEIPKYIAAATARNPRFLQFKRPNLPDDLFKSNYDHVDPNDRSCKLCEKDNEHLESRDPREGPEGVPVVHFGTVASGNQVIKDGSERSMISATYPSVLAVEMEAAGLMNIFGCATIRGICDYADSHKNDGWQNFAAAAAASCVREVLQIIPRVKLEATLALSTLSEIEIECLQCLYTSDYDSYKLLLQSPIDGTCAWFLQHKTYTTWREGQSSLLWVSGVPGSGKSVLSSFLIDQLHSSGSDPSLSSTVLYFFFKHDNDSLRNATSALCALLHQLFKAKASLIHYAIPEFRAKPRQKFLESFGTLWNIFTTAVADKNCGSIVCIVDGLDECETSTQKLLIQELVRFYSSDEKRINLKFLVTSRPHASIEQQFDSLLKIRLKTEDETTAISSDIELVVKSRVKEIGSLRKISQTVQSNLEKKLIQNADRTFLWVSLILQMIEESARVSKRALDNLMNTIPYELDAVYEKILQETVNAEDTRKILHIVAAATRPLSLKEIGLAFVIDLSDKSYADLDLEPSIEYTIKKLCGIFVRIMESKVYLVHQTAKEFLVQKANSVPGLWRYTLDLVESNSMLADICVSYLQFTVFDHDLQIPRSTRSIEEVDHVTTADNQDRNTQGAGHGQNVGGNKHDAKEDDDRDSGEDEQAGREEKVDSQKDERDIQDEVRQYTQEHYFLDYAAKHWADHVREAKVTENAALLTRVFAICDTQSQRFLTWFKVYWASISSSSYPRRLTPLMVGSSFGHDAVVKLLLEKGVEIDSKDSHGRTSLHRAAMHGHEGVVRMLLDNGAGIDIEDEWKLTALCFAAKSGHKEVVQLLLGRDADINRADIEGRTALHASASSGHEAVTRVLLDKGADVNSQQQNYSPLHLASWKGHEWVVRLLLEKGARVDTKSGGKCPNTALHLAASCGNDAVARLLLEAGADIEAKGWWADLPIGEFGGGQTVLQMAAKARDEVMTRSILEKKADIHSQDENGWTALHWATLGKDPNEAVVQLLLERGAAVNATGNKGQTALSMAASSGSTAVVRLLLEKWGADINGVNVLGETTLHVAAEFGRERVVELILEKGTDVNVKDKRGGTALLTAARGGHEAVVLLLMEREADIQANDMEGLTALHMAASSGHEAVARLLLEKGKADIHATDELGRTALHTAAFSKCKEVAQLLLEKGANVKASDREGRTALHGAAFSGHKAIARLLLKSGADVDAKDEEGRTALPMAAFSGHKALARLLIESGADINARDSDGRTALHAASSTGQERRIRKHRVRHDIR